MQLRLKLQIRLQQGTTQTHLGHTHTHLRHTTAFHQYAFEVLVLLALFSKGKNDKVRTCIDCSERQ